MISRQLAEEPHGSWRSIELAPGAIGALELIAAGKHANGETTNATTEKINVRAARPARKSVDSPLKICCLGFHVIRRGGNIPITIRTNTRPALLLRLLIASGPGGVAKQQAERVLWPLDATARDQRPVDSTLYRLRQLLQSERACRLDHGMILLDTKFVSIDAWLFETEADVLLNRLRHAARLDAGEIAVRVERLLELYRGPFFAADDSLPAIVQTRDRLKGKFTQAIARTGEFWQEAGRWDRAQQLHEHALTLDNLAEETHREIMRCHLAQGHFAEAVRAFNRCRELLASVLGMTPSDETLLLYRRALLGRDDDRAVN
jgi:LuxR family transcriptional regulator, maltose regulon positive regulatory protein